MATLTAQSPSVAGTAQALVAASGGGDQVLPGDNVHLVVANGGGSPITVTVASQRKCDQGATHNLSVSVAAGATELIGPLPASRFADNTGYCQVTYSSVTSVTVGAVLEHP